MALDINGYDSAFRGFAESARRRNAKAVARRPSGNPTVTGCKTDPTPA